MDMRDSESFSLSRRRFVQGLIAGTSVLGTSMPSFAMGQPTAYGTRSPDVLTGTEFDLVIDQGPVNFTGQANTGIMINGSIPAPTLIWREGDTITLRVTNRSSVPTSVHWHGIILPYQMDGVPGLSYAGIAPGQTFTYRFRVQQSGTYWYHSHTGFQEMSGMYGSLVILPRDGDGVKSDRDFVVQLSDWTDENPMEVFAKLKQQSDYYNYAQPTVADFFEDVSRYDLRTAMAKREMWNEMRMNPTDLADLSASTLTYLCNGQPPNGNWTGIFKPGDTVRLRFVNGASNSFFDVRIPGLLMTVIQADGQNIEPVSVDEFRFGPGETYDVLVYPKDDAYTILPSRWTEAAMPRGRSRCAMACRLPFPHSIRSNG